MPRHEPADTPRTGWFTSSFSANNSSCVEVRFDRPAVRVRDSKNPDAESPLAFDAASWAAFLGALRTSTQ